MSPTMMLELLAADLNELTLSARDGLPKAQNGRPFAPSSDFAVRIRKEMQQVQSKEWLRISTVLHTDLADGVAYERVRLPLVRIDASLALRAGVTLEQPLRSLSIAEQRTDGALDLDQLRLPESENDPAFLERFIERCAQQEHSIRVLRRAAELRVLRLRGSVRRPEPSASTGKQMHHACRELTA